MKTTALFVFLLATSSLASVPASAQTTWPPTVQHLVTQAPGMRPTLALNGNVLAVGSRGAVDLFYFAPSWHVWTSLRTVGTTGNTEMVADPVTRTFVNCTELGNAMHFIHPDNPHGTVVQRFNDRSGLNCAGISFDDREPGRLWIGSTGNRVVAQLEPNRLAVTRRFEGVSGPFKLKKIGNYLFTSNGLVLLDGGFIPGVNMPLPLVLDARTGRAVVGDKLGDTNRTTLRREFNYEIFDDSLASGYVFYLNLVSQEMIGFRADAPSEADMLRIPTGEGNALRLLRHGRCLVLSSLSENEMLYPKWTIFRDDDRGGFEKIGTTPFLEDTSLNGPIETAIDRAGNIYLSHWDGVSRVEGVLAGYGCE